MVKYLSTRGLVSLATAFLVLVFVFVAARLTGNPFAVMYPDGLEPGQLDLYNEKYGLDRSYPEQFVIYISNVLQGDFGESIVARRPVQDVFLPRFAETLKLGVFALLLSLLVGVPVGLALALFPKAPLVRLTGHLMSVLYAVPGFVLALVLILTLSFTFNILPSQGAATPAHYIMPVVCLAISPIVTIARNTDNSVRETLHQDYVRTAIGKGIGRRHVVWRHVFPNTLIPVLTQVSIITIDILSGTMIIETIFSWPGMGTLLVNSVLNRDYPVIQFSVVTISLMVIALNYLLDAVYLLVDPRIGRTKGAGQ